jgi:hypothetical protein
MRPKLCAASLEVTAMSLSLSNRSVNCSYRTDIHTHVLDAATRELFSCDDVPTLNGQDSVEEDILRCNDKAMTINCEWHNTCMVTRIGSVARMLMVFTESLIRQHPSPGLTKYSKLYSISSSSVSWACRYILKEEINDKLFFNII